MPNKPARRSRMQVVLDFFRGEGTPDEIRAARLILEAEEQLTKQVKAASPNVLREQRAAKPKRHRRTKAEMAEVNTRTVHNPRPIVKANGSDLVGTVDAEKAPF